MELKSAFAPVVEGYAKSAVESLKTMSEISRKRGLILPILRETSIERFKRLDPVLQAKHAHQLEKYLPLFAQQVETADEFMNVSVEDEIECLKTVCDTYKVRYTRDMDNTLREGDVIEIYDLEGLQIYRNLNFFRISNYNLMDIMSHTWMELWDRPALVQESLTQMAIRVMGTDEGRIVAPCRVPDHILKERAFGFSQALLIQFQNATRVEDEQGRAFGALLTLRAEPLAEGLEADKIGFV